MGAVDTEDTSLHGLLQFIHNPGLQSTNHPLHLTILEIQVVVITDPDQVTLLQAMAAVITDPDQVILLQVMAAVAGIDHPAEGD